MRLPKKLKPNTTFPGFFFQDANFISRLSNATMILLAGILISLLIFRAWNCLDTNWDAIAYHLPFAALRTGIITERSFVFDSGLVYYYKGFPVIHDLIKGGIWKITGKPESTNLLELISLFLFCLYLRLSFKVYFSWALVALLAVPAVQSQASGNYIDLFVNLAFTIGLLSLYDILKNIHNFGPGKLFIFYLSCFLCANSKLFFQPFVGLLVVVFLMIFFLKRRELPEKTDKFVRSRPIITAIVTIVLVCSIFYKPIQNSFEYHNPLFPVNISIAGLELAGPLPQIELVNANPLYLAGKPQFLKWLGSIFEFKALGLRVIPWTVDQGDVSANADSFRMGGFFGFYVAWNLMILMYLAFLRKGNSSKTLLIILGSLTVLTANFPGFHELRYSMYWMIFLVSSNLLILFESPIEFQKLRPVYGAVMICVLFFVVSVTGGHHLGCRKGRDAESIVASNDIRGTLEKILEGSDHNPKICACKLPYNFLFHPLFHPSLDSKYHYSIVPCNVPVGDCNDNIIKMN